ncbi:MAG: hypothetical protein P0S96_06395 [Simkaniaceae bacterium]|nr:hypothetical protein [Candidatus Sacchlamyda saccharinae]
MKKHLLWLFLATLFSSLQADSESISFDPRIYKIHPKNALVYAQKGWDQSFVSLLGRTFNGLTNRRQIDRLLKDQNYIDVLNHVWTEPDLGTRIRWLEKKVDEGHPILVLELTKAYFLQNPSLESYVEKVLPWLRAANYRMEVDSKCTSDKSVLDAIHECVNLHESYLVQILLERYTNAEIEAFYIENIEKSLLVEIDLKKRVLFPFFDEKMEVASSPEWLFNSGMLAFYDTPNTIPREKWNSIRKEHAFFFCESIYAVENELRSNKDDFMTWYKDSGRINEDNY